ncbi:hypothetical protein BGW37DRAFT_509780 [Umbelopsis sp. PMI_123]|nr:hypothetical protein BGW37DRAFT_509780 [Umbelopsis sp. PMI_123]
MEHSKSNDDGVTESETLEALQKSVKQIEHSFSTVYSTLSRNFQQNLSMIQGMTSTLEHVLKSSIKIGTKIEMSKDGEATPTVTITILNASQFPMKSLLAEIQFVPVQNDCNGTVSFESKSSSRLVKNIPTSTQSLFDGESELLPEEKHLEIITVWSSCLAQYNGNITVSVLSPGTGQKLQAYHKFGLYIIDQLKKSFHLPYDDISSPNADRTINSQHCIDKTYDLTYFRGIMGFRPAQGITPGITIELIYEPSNVRVECHVIALSDDNSKAECRFGYNGDQASGTAMETLLSELDFLGNLEHV